MSVVLRWLKRPQKNYQTIKSSSDCRPVLNKQKINTRPDGVKRDPFGGGRLLRDSYTGTNGFGPWCITNHKTMWLKQVSTDCTNIPRKHLSPGHDCAPHWHVFMFPTHHTLCLGENQATFEQAEALKQQLSSRFKASALLTSYAIKAQNSLLAYSE